MSKSHRKKTEEPSKEETQNEDQDDAAFILGATRAPRAGAYEHFLTQSLAQTIFMTDDLKRTKAVTVAALMVLEAEREKVAIDYDLIRVLNQDASALLNPSVRKIPDSNMEIISVPWGFPETEDNYKTFILPWFNCKPFYWPVMLRKHGETWRTWHCYYCTAEVMKAKLPLPDTQRLPRSCPKCHRFCVDPYNNMIVYLTTNDETTINKEPFWSFFFDLTISLTPQGYDILKNNFVGWAISPTQAILSELTRMVDPNLYAEMLGLYSTRRGKQNLSEKVKEAAEGSKSDNPLG